MIIIFKDKNTGAQFRQKMAVGSSLVGCVIKCVRPSAIEFTRRELQELQRNPNYLEHLIRSMVDKDDSPPISK